jgi:unsaturated chondroitin disaccharide hydrolase
MTCVRTYSEIKYASVVSRYLLCAALIACVAVLSSCSTGDDVSGTNELLVDDLFAFAGARLERAVEQVGSGDRFPRFTDESGQWVCLESGAWSSGFFAGCLWFMYEHTGEDVWRERAEVWTDGMEQEQFTTSDHNNGFKMMSSFGHGYRLTGDDHYREVLIQSARSLASRFTTAVGMVRSNDMPQWQYPVLIDTMVNIELLFWAAENGGDPHWARMAEMHAVNSMKNHIRADGGTIQVVDHDPETGAVLGHDTLCGLSGDTMWSRGQGQAIYGFAAAYRYTDNELLLDAACRVADTFIAALPPDSVPYWDRDDPAIPNTIRDASAAAVAAAGLLDLADLVPDSENSDRYRHTATDMLRALGSDAYRGADAGGVGIIGHATWKKPTDPQADTSLIWGDYNVLQALLRYERGIPEN